MIDQRNRVTNAISRRINAVHLAYGEGILVCPTNAGGVVAFDNALWHDRVADPSVRDDETLAIRELIRQVSENDGLVPILLPVGDGLLLAKKEWTPEAD